MNTGAAMQANDEEHGAGYRLVRQPDGPPVLFLGRWTAEAERVLAAAPVLAVRIESGFGPLDPLVPFAERIRSVQVAEGFAASLKPLNRLSGLESLILLCPPKGVELASFPALRRCDLAAAGSLAGLAEGLEELAVDRPKVETLRELASLRRLRSLQIDAPPRLVSLEGIEGLSLERLEVSRARVLRSVGAVASLPSLRTLRLRGVREVTDLERVGEASPLEALEIEGGPALSGLGFLGGLRNLRSLSIDATEVAPGGGGAAPLEALTGLRKLHLASGVKDAEELDGLARLTHLEGLFIDNAGEIRSLGFVRALRRLRSFRIDRTRVADRDLSPLLELEGLQEVRIAPQNKKYSPTAEEVVAAVRARNPELYRAREARVQAARAMASAPPAPPSTPAAARPAVLAGISWRLDEEVSGTDDLVRRVRDAGAEWDAEQVAVPAPRIRVRVPGEAPVELASDGARGFTAGELLFKVHQAVGPLVRDTDHRYFEGLIPASDTAGGVPLFDLRLGS